jgi:ABC-type sugar transport system permease subunit
MTTVSFTADQRTALLLRALPIWHGVLLLVFLALSGMLVFGNLAPQANVVVRWGGGLVLLGGAALSGLAIPNLLRRDHAGRALSLTVNYLAWVACCLALFQVTGVFLAFDALADTFAGGLPFLPGVFLGYMVNSWGDRYEHDPAREQLFRKIGNGLMALFGVIFFIAVSGLTGVVVWLGRLLDPAALGAVFGLVALSLAIWAAWRQPTAEAFAARASHAEMLNGLLFLSPNLLGFLIFFAGPLLISFYISFTNSDAVSPPQWIWFQNYIDILGLTVAPLAAPDQLAREVVDITRYSELTRFALGAQSYLIGATDKLFWVSLGNTFTFVLLAVPLSVIPALVLSTLLNSDLRGMKFFRAVYFIPSVAAVVGISLIWQLLYNASVGYINYGIAGAVGFINELTGSAIADPAIRWLSDGKTALFAIVIVSAWQTMGFNTVLFLAGLQNIPASLYEAATVDGAGSWAKFWHITLPMLAPTTFFVVTTTTIQAMQVFEQVFILMNPPEGPNNATLTIVLYLYRNGFQNFKQGYGSAIAWILFVLIFVLTLVQFQRQRQSTAYEG